MNETEVRSALLEAAQFQADLCASADTLHDQALDHAQAARALAEGAAYLLGGDQGAPDPPGLSDAARAALAEILDEHEDAYPSWRPGVLLELRALAR